MGKLLELLMYVVVVVLTPFRDLVEDMLDDD